MNGSDNTPTEGRRRVVIVTGPSGAGRGTAIHALEDFGFEAIDNLPLTLLPRLLSGPLERNLALGVDVRNRDFSTEALIEVVDIITSETEFDCTLVYLDCAIETLVRRYSETRRRHPMAPGETAEEGIARELQVLGSLRGRADILIDTSDMSPHELRDELAIWFADATEQGLAISVQSFSYKRGMPHGLDMVIDCRFLRNPHWQKALRPLDGRDERVARHIAEDPQYPEFSDRLRELVLSLLPAYRREGKSHFTLALGCTGGQHRSVHMAEAMANALAESGWQVSIRHRELERRAGGAHIRQ